MKKNYNLTLINAGQGRERGGTGRGRSKKCKPILALPRGAGLKSRPIPAPPPLRGGENPRELKQGGAGQVEWGKIVIPMGRKHLDLTMYFPFSLLNQTHSKKFFLLIFSPKSVGVTLINLFFFMSRTFCVYVPPSLSTP